MTVNSTRKQKAAGFRALHEGETFLIPNPWDAGSARVFEALGFKALATTSSGFAFTLGRLDGAVTLDELAGHVEALDRATGLPVSVDLENGFGPRPEDAAAAISRAAAAGAVGGSIEDYDHEAGLYSFDHAVERVAAAAESAQGLDFPFTFTARAENQIRGNPDLDDTIARLQAFAGSASAAASPGRPSRRWRRWWNGSATRATSPAWRPPHRSGSGSPVEVPRRRSVAPRPAHTLPS